MFGYCGRFLHIDLSTCKTKNLEFPPDELKQYIGGSALAARLIYGQVEPGDPLGSDKLLILAAGPFVGTGIPMSSRIAICGISPLTGIWGESTTAGIFPVKLKAAGFDGIAVTGKADRPVYLYLTEGKVEIRDASSLWGKDIYETQKSLKDELKVDGLSVASIGQAGENMVSYACVMNDHGRAAGRCGMGALMGSKKLKAIAASGNIKVGVANPEKITELTKQARDLAMSSMDMFKQFGTMGYVEIAQLLSDMPARYFTKNVFPTEKISATKLKESYLVKGLSCHGCPVACGRHILNFRENVDVDGPEFETVGSFGPLCMNFDLESIIIANHLCNAYGIDTISAGVSIAFAMYLFDKGLLTEKRAGMKIKWGDTDTIIKLINLIVKREGIGEILGEGTRKMARELGIDADEAANVKGLEVPMHDARAFPGQAICYATSPRGACHMKGNYYRVELGWSIPELDIAQSDDRFKSEQKAAISARLQNYLENFDSLLLCKFAPFSATLIAEVFTNVTGWECNPTDLNIIGERSITIKRAINNKLGITREDDKMPRITVEALKEGASEGKAPDMAVLLKEYYDYRQWDWNTGKPEKQKLIELGLKDVAKDLWPENE